VVPTTHPGLEEPKGADEVDLRTQLKMASHFHKRSHLFALGAAPTSLTRTTWGATFGRSARILGWQGQHHVDSDSGPRRLSICQASSSPTFSPRNHLLRYASNNNAFCFRRGGPDLEPASAWGPWQREAPAIASLHLHFPNPRGQDWSTVPHRPYFWGIWQWALNNRQRKTCCVRPASATSSSPVSAFPRRAMTSRHSCLWRICPVGPKSVRRRARSILSGAPPTMMPSTTSSAPARRGHRVQI